MGKKLTRRILSIGSSHQAADIRYATGFQPLDPIVFFQEGARRFLVVPALEMGRARQSAPGTTVVTPQQLPITRKQGGQLFYWALGLLKYLKVRGVQVDPWFPLSLADRLRAAGINVRVHPGPLFPERETKSKEEVRCIAESQAAAVAAMRAATRLIGSATISRQGFLKSGSRRLTSEAVRTTIEKTLLDHQASAMETIVAGGRQAADPHERGHGPLKAGETIVLDIFPQHRVHGYWGDITRTVIRGRPSPQQKKMYDAVKAAQAKALKEVRAGVQARTVHGAASEELERRGFTTTVSATTTEGFFHSTGHGVGLEIHEAPRVSTNDTKLRSGHVITIEPGLYYEELGGVRIEDTVVVTPKGYRMLAACEKRFEI